MTSKLFDDSKPSFMSKPFHFIYSDEPMNRINEDGAGQGKQHIFEINFQVKPADGKQV